MHSAQQRVLWLKMPVALRLSDLVGSDLFITNKCPPPHPPHNAFCVTCSEGESWGPELRYLQRSEGKWLRWNPPRLRASSKTEDARISHGPMRPHRRESYWVVPSGTPHERTKPDSGVGRQKPAAKGEVVSGRLERV